MKKYMGCVILCVILVCVVLLLMVIVASIKNNPTVNEGDWLSQDEYTSESEGAQREELSSLENEDCTEEMTRFALEKIHFDVSGYNIELKEDEDVVKALDYMMGMWQDTYDSVEFVFYCDEMFEENIFEDMHYAEMWGVREPLGVAIEVEYANINIEALKRLSQRKEIRAIYIMEPTYHPIDDEPGVEGS